MRGLWGELPGDRKVMGEDIDRICSILSRHRFRVHSEEELQRAIAQVLRSVTLDAREYVRLSKADVIDIMVDRVGVELKVDGSYALVARQLHRYAQSDAVDALILVTTRSSHLRLNGLEMNGKCLRVFYLSMSAAF